MNKTVGLKSKNTSSKGKINGGIKRPTLAFLLAQQTPEKKAALEKQMYEKLGLDVDYLALYDDIAANREAIIERCKLSWDDIKALQNAWKEIHGPHYNHELKNDLTK